MYKNNQRTQHNECLICQKKIDNRPSIVHIVQSLPLCLDCIHQFDIINKTIDFYHYPLTILYYYNTFFQSLLYQYKGLYDYALKDTFLCLFLKEFKEYYHDYIIVLAPSSLEDNKVRLFNPNEAIALTFSHNIFTGLYKKEKYKQSNLSYHERQKVKEKIGIYNGGLLTNKKVLIFDDVITSGSTLLTCLSLVESYHPQKIELFVLSTRHSSFL